MINSTGGLSAIEGTAADGRIDLVTVLAHEFNHLLGIGHGEELMSETLEVGTRLIDVADSDGDEPATTTPVYPFLLYLRHMLTDSHLLIDERDTSHWRLIYDDDYGFGLGLAKTN